MYGGIGAGLSGWGGMLVPPILILATLGEELETREELLV